MWLDAGKVPFVRFKTATDFHLAFFQEVIAIFPLVEKPHSSLPEIFLGALWHSIQSGATSSPLPCAILSSEAVQTP
jgi:hypothetical protein